MCIGVMVSGRGRGSVCWFASGAKGRAISVFDGADMHDTLDGLCLHFSRHLAVLFFS
jgi:hypothetical protein